MDRWLNVIMCALKREDGSPEERRIALMRAGRIAEAYFGSDCATMEAVFGSGSSLCALQDSADVNKSLSGTARQ